MHDPMSTAFTISMFWVKKSEWGYRPPLITIWHVDPEKDGSDDSCDWWWRKCLTPEEKAFAASLIENDFDNLRAYFSTFVPEACPKHGTNHDDCDMNDPNCKYGEFVENCSREEMINRICGIMRCYKKKTRWRYPVRWHFWHWKLQIHPLQTFKRWAFSQCMKCGKGFAWGYSPVTTNWYSKGPRWFRSEPDVFHSNCSDPNNDQPCQALQQQEPK